MTEDKYKPLEIKVVTTLENGRFHHSTSGVWTRPLDPLDVPEEYIDKVKKYHEILFEARQDRKSLTTRISIFTEGK